MSASSSQAIKPALPGRDIPQADSLDQVRRVLHAVAEGARRAPGVRRATGISSRHVAYALHAARVLGFMQVEDRRFLRLTASGEALLFTPPGGEAERQALWQAVRHSPTMQLLCPALLHETAEPDPRHLAQHIERLGAFAPDTARRRVQTLLAWRQRILRGPRGAASAAPRTETWRARPAATPALAGSEDPGRFDAVEVQLHPGAERLRGALAAVTLLRGPRGAGRRVLDAIWAQREGLEDDAPQVTFERGGARWDAAQLGRSLRLWLPRPEAPLLSLCAVLYSAQPGEFLLIDMGDLGEWGGADLALAAAQCRGQALIAATASGRGAPLAWEPLSGQ